MAWSKNLDWSVFYQIPDGLRDCYLAKLGMEVQSPSRDYLDNLVRAHQCIIPFENLAVTLWNEPVSIEPHALMDKLLQTKGTVLLQSNSTYSINYQYFRTIFRIQKFQRKILPKSTGNTLKNS